MFADSLYSGHGVLKQKSTSTVYVGEWKEGKRHGYGVSDSNGMYKTCNNIIYENIALFIYRLMKSASR